MTKVQSLTIAGISTIALVVGVLLAGGAMTSAQSTTVTPTPVPSGATPAPGGTFKSNEDPAHEANETAEEEAAEDSGQGHGRHGGGHSNEDPAHEANESAEREA